MDGMGHNEFLVSTQSKSDLRNHDKYGLIATEESDVERREHTITESANAYKIH